MHNQIRLEPDWIPREHCEHPHGSTQIHPFTFRHHLSTCNFSEDDGHHISGTESTTKKVDAVRLAPAPKNQRELRSFLGMLHYYGKLVTNLATLIHPLNSLLKMNSPWKWSKECE